jgi:hypothetical protein
MLAGTAAGAAVGTCSATAGTSVSGAPRSVVEAALAGTGPDSDGIVVETDSVVGTDSVRVGSDFQDGDTSSSLGPTLSLSPPVVCITTGRCTGVGCGGGCTAGSDFALDGNGSDGDGVTVSVGGVSTGGVVLTGGAVGVGVGSSATGFPLPIVVFSPVGCPGGESCSFEEGCSFAQASLAARTKAERHKTSTTNRARDLRLCRGAWMAVFLCGCPRVKSLRTLPLVWR